MSFYKITSKGFRGLLLNRLKYSLNNNNIINNNIHFHSLINPLTTKRISGQVPILHRLGPNTTILQQFEFSSSTSSTSDEKAKSDSEKVDDNKEAIETATEATGDANQSKDSSSDSSEDKEEELTVEDLVKLVTEKEELLKVKHKEIENMQQKVLRTYAEMENVMDRTRREAENSKKFAIQNFAKGLLDVADNLGRAASVVKESFSKLDTTKDSAGAAPLLKTLLEGVEMTEKQLNEVFKKFGVEKYDPTGEQFDPNRHNAVFQVPDASKPSGTVQIVLKSGYVLHDRVIRPAEVGVTEAVENTETDQASKE